MDLYDFVIILILLTFVVLIRYNSVNYIKKQELNNCSEEYQIISQNNQDNKTNHDKNQNIIDKDQDKQDIYNLLKILSEQMDSNNITYWIIGGTLLGSVRHNDLIPWESILVDIKVYKSL